MANVPNLPGVPSLSSYTSNTLSLLISDAISIINAFFGPQWGIFLNGAQVIPYNSVLDFDYKQDWPLSDYPVEDGGFQSYDKVQLPFDIKIRLASGGTEAERQALLAAVDFYANSLELFDVITPEKAYTSCNITHYDYKRSSHNGVGVIVVDLWFIEVRVTATSTYTNTQSPGVAGPQSSGAVTPEAAPQAFQQRWGAFTSLSGVQGGH
jgi:hypothetical protein